MFTLQSHTFHTFHTSFPRVTYLPSFLLYQFFFRRLFLAPISLDLHIAECCVAHGSLIISIRQAEIKDVGLWIPSCCLNWITVACVYPNPCLVSWFCANFIQMTDISASKVAASSTQHVFSLSLSLWQVLLYTQICFFRRSHLEVCGLCCFPWLWGMTVRSPVSLMAKVSSNE